MPDFKSLLSKPVDNIERPKAWPAGTYTGMVGNYELGESRAKKTPYVRFALNITGAGEDILPEDLDGIDLSKRQFRVDFYLTPDSEYRLKEFIESLGVPTAGRTFMELLPETQGHEVLISIKQRNSEDGSEVFNDVDRVKGVSA